MFSLLKNASKRVVKTHPCAIHKGVIITLVPYKRGHFEILVQA
jgi:hypothetical protein